MSSPHRARITKIPLRPMKTFIRQFSPLITTPSRSPQTPLSTIQASSSKVSTTTNTPQFKMKPIIKKSHPGFLSARYKETESFKKLEDVNSKGIRTARESPTFLNITPRKILAKMPVRSTSNPAVRRITTETEKDSSGSMDVSSKVHIDPSFEAARKDKYLSRRKVFRQSSLHQFKKGFEGYGLITPHLVTEDSQSTIRKVSELVDDWYKGAGDKMQKMATAQEFYVNKKGLLSNTSLRTSKYGVGSASKRNDTSKEKSVTFKVSLEDIKKRYFPLWGGDATEQNKSDHFMGSTATSRGRVKIPTNESIAVKDIGNNRQETENVARPDSKHDFSWAMNSVNSSLNEVEVLYSPGKSKGQVQVQDLFTTTQGSYCEVNPCHREIIELHKETRGPDGYFIQEPDPTGNSPTQATKPNWHKIGNRFNHEPEIVMISQGKTIVQPVYMEKAGSMCFTELWDFKQRRIVNGFMQNSVNHLRLNNPERESEGLYRPNKWKRQDRVHKMIAEQEQQKCYSPIKALAGDKVGFRVYDDVPKTPDRRSTSRERKRSPPKENAPNREEEKSPSGMRRGHLRSYSSPQNDNNTTESSPSPVKNRRVRRVRKESEGAKMFFMAHLHELAASIVG